ncbi:MAG: EamA family transporter [Haloplanus sp.]
MIPEIPGVVYALTSAFSWALSTVLVNRGLARLRRRDGGRDIALGLAASLLTGSVLLSAVVLPRFDPGTITLTLVLAGVFTFPLGTGLYYLTAELYMQNAEIAAQFVKVKPIFSVVFALLLGERLGRLTGMGLGLIVAGLAVLLVATVRSAFSRLATIIGLTTALSWSVGEALMKVGVADVSSLVATYIALITGTAVYLVVAIPFMYGEVRPRAAYREGWLLPFVGHGVLSMALAYTTFFTAIKAIGLAQTALITAFWPMLAIGLNYTIDRARGEPARTEIGMRYLLSASGLLVLGSLLAAL